MGEEQRANIDKAVKELGRAFLWRAEICANIALVMQNAPKLSLTFDPATRQVSPAGLPYANEAQQLDEVNQLIARLIHQIEMASTPEAVSKWYQHRQEVLSAEQMVILARYDALNTAILNAQETADDR